MGTVESPKIERGKYREKTVPLVLERGLWIAQMTSLDSGVLNCRF